MLFDPKWKPPVIQTRRRAPEVKAKGLTTKQVRYLKKVMKKLKDGSIVEKGFFDSSKSNNMLFNMGLVMSLEVDYSKNRPQHCGTAGCIAGWMMILERVDAGQSYKQAINAGYDDKLLDAPRLKSLFFPAAWIMDTAKPEDGVRAIDNFLYRGHKSPWRFMHTKYPTAKAEYTSKYGNYED